MNHRSLLSMLVALGACGGPEETRDAGPREDAGSRVEDSAVLSDAGMDACEPRPFFRDADGDGFGDPTMSELACDAPEGFVEDSGDCDDTVSGPQTTTFYADADGDTYGDASMPVEACALAAGLAENADDCDDSMSAVFPGATEVCNAIDDDCSGAPDDPFECAQGSMVDCRTTCGSVGTGTCTADCMIPAAASCAIPAERCNVRTDDDCDGRIDEGVLSLLPTTRYAFGSSYEAPVAIHRNLVGGEGQIVASLWLRGGSIYGFTHNIDSGNPSTVLEMSVAARSRFHAAAGFTEPVVAYIDADGTAQGEVVVSGLLSTTLVPRYTRRIATAVGGQLYTDVRVIGSIDRILVFPRLRDGVLREVIFNRSDGMLLDETTLFATTSGPYAVSGDEVRYAIAMPRRAMDGTYSVAIHLGGTAGSMTRNISLLDRVPRDVAVHVDDGVSPPNLLVVWSELRVDGTGRVEYAFYDGLSTIPLTGTVAMATTPMSTEGQQLAIQQGRNGEYYVIVVEATTPASANGTPRVYQLFAASSPPVLLPVMGEIASGLHRRISSARCTNCGIATVWHTPVGETGIAGTRIACAP